jgi:hypothetical protein
VNLVISDELMQGGDKLRRFQIEMTLNPDAQAAQLAGQDKRDDKTAAVQLTK